MSYSKNFFSTAFPNEPVPQVIRTFFRLQNYSSLFPTTKLKAIHDISTNRGAKIIGLPQAAIRNTELPSAKAYFGLG